MANYKVEIGSSAEKALWKLPKAIVPRLVQAIHSLATDPRPSGCRKLSGEKDAYRIRVGLYRVIYEIHDHLILVKVLKIGHRKDIYR